MKTYLNYVQPEAEIVRLDAAMVLCESKDNVNARIDGYTEDTPILEF